MKFFNFDFSFIQRESTASPYYSTILFERVNDDEGIEMTFDIYSKLFKSFIKKVYTKISNSQEDYPEQVMTGITNFLEIEDPELADVEKLSSFLKYWNYEVLCVARLDANDGPREIVQDYEARSYMINNFEFNSTGCSSFYVGYSIIFESELYYPYAMDYIDSGIFGLSYDDLEDYQLLISQKTYNLLRSQDNLKIFDDSNSMAFIESRGYRFLVCNNLI